MKKYTIVLDGGKFITVTAAGYVVHDGVITFFAEFEGDGRVKQPKNPTSFYRTSAIVGFWPHDHLRDQSNEFGVEELFK